MRKIEDELKKGEFHTLYLIYGEEDYLRKQYCDRLRDALVSKDDSMNYSCFNGTDIDIAKIIDLSETMPFFKDRRVIVIENSGLMKKGGEALADYLKSKPETTTFIFDEQEADKRTGLYKIVNSKGVADEMPRLDPGSLAKWLMKNIKEEKKNMTRSDLDYFISLTGNNMNVISNEFEKLMCYTDGRDVVTRKDMDDVCVRQIEDKIFLMVEDMAAHRTREALSLFTDLLERDEPVFRILSLIVTEYKKLLEAKMLVMNGAGFTEIKQKIPYYSNKYIGQARKMDISEIKDALAKCCDTDEAIKTGNMTDRTAIAVLVTELGSGQLE